MGMRLLIISALISCATGHGWVTRPTSRASLGCDPYSGYFCETHQATRSACDNLPCGECHLPVHGGNCTAGVYPGYATPKEPYCNPDQINGTSFLEVAGEVQAAWTAGEVVEVAWAVSVNHRGNYQYRLCLDGHDSEDCFKKTPLPFADGKMWHWIDATCTTCNGTVSDHGSEAPLLKDRIVIPSHIQCERCTLSWRWDAYEESTIFTGCSDVSITRSSVTLV